MRTSADFWLRDVSKKRGCTQEQGGYEDRVHREAREYERREWGTHMAVWTEMLEALGLDIEMQSHLKGTGKKTINVTYV